MTQNKIKVLFFSKTASFSEAMMSIFADEIDFSYRSLLRLDQLSEIPQTSLDTIAIVDVFESVDDLIQLVEKKHVNLSSLTLILLLDDDRKVSQVLEENFIFCEKVHKPFRVEHLLSKIRSCVTNLKLLEESFFLSGGTYFDLRKNEIRNTEGRSVRLTEKEIEIIIFLYKEKGKITQKEVLLKNIWGYNAAVSTHTVETHIYRLRKKIQLGLGEVELIKKNDIGYYLNVPQFSRL